MTPEQIEKHRSRFEELYLPKFGFHSCFEKYPDGMYVYSEVRVGFDCYLLCAKNIEIELPPTVKWREDESVEGAQHRYTINTLLNVIRANIESQGIKIKSSGSE